MKVQGPNGLVVDIAEPVATGLVGDGSRGYRFVSEEKKSEEAPRPRRARAPKRSE